MKALLTLVAVVLVAAGAIAVMNSNSPDKSPTPPVEASADEGSAIVQSGVLTSEDTANAEESEVGEVEELPRKLRLYFPDGTWLPALNGATNPKPVEFRNRPYSPVVRKAYDASRKRYWYVHADGSWSTTVRDNFRGQKNTITQVAHPTETHILLDEKPDGTREVIVPKKPARRQ